MQFNDQVNEDFELQDINKETILTISDDDTEYCCICINTITDVFIKLQCCNQSIHENCIIEFITSINNNVYNCPICRKKLDIPVSFGKIIDYINKNLELISKEKFQNIINNLYKDIQIKDLFFNINETAEIQHLKNTIHKLTVKNDKFRVIIMFISIPLFVIFSIILFNETVKN